MTEMGEKEAGPSRAGFLASRQVNWYETFCYAERLAANHGVDILEHHLVAGSPRWCEMPDDDARKLMALVLGGIREALGHDANQTSLVDASRAVSAAEDWPAIAHGIGRRNGVYIPRRKGAA